MKPSYQLLFNFIITLLILNPSKACAAACCGGSASSSALITGDHKAIFNALYSWTDVIVDSVDGSGYWYTSTEHQKVQNLRLEASHIFWDRFQAGLSLPIISRQKFSETYTGLGDIVGTMGYEYLPDWDYNPYRPHGVGFLTLTLPTGKSKVDSSVGGLDSRGNGLWAFGVGSFLNKSWSSWDVVQSIEVHRSFQRTVTSGLTLKPGFGGNLMLGGGYSWGNYRLGSGLTWTYEDAIEISQGISTSTGSPERYATFSFMLSYLWSDAWSGTLSYLDQTLFGEPSNTSLGRGFSVQIQHRFSR